MAAPMPRVPPVTNATRAISNSRAFAAFCLLSTDRPATRPYAINFRRDRLPCYFLTLRRLRKSGRTLVPNELRSALHTHGDANAYSDAKRREILHSIASLPIRLH